MKKLVFGLFLIFTLCGTLFFVSNLPADASSTGPAVEMSNRYSGAAFDGRTYTVIQTSDGGYVIVGSTDSFGAGGSDVYLVKTDSTGTLQWRKTYGGTGNDYGFSVVQTGDGGYTILCNTIGGMGNAWLVKTDSSGNMQWNKSYTEMGEATANGFVQTNDGGYAIAGVKVGWDGWLMKTDGDGTMQWSKSFSVVNNSQLVSVVQTDEGGYIAVGATQYPPFSGKVDAYLVRTDSEGNLIWSKDYSRTTGNDYGESIIHTSDGGYAIAGETDSFGNADFWLIKIDLSGNLLWDRTFGGTGWDGSRSIVQTNDGGYELVGKTNSFGAGVNDLWLVKTDVDGYMQWNKTFGGTGDDVGTSIIHTSDGGFALAGYTNSFSGDGSYEVWLIKLVATGSPIPSTDLSIQLLIESLSLSSIKVTISLRFENDNSPVEDAIVKINNVAAEHVGEGLYIVVLNTLAPYLTLNTSVERTGATQQTTDVTIWAQGNSILWTLLIIIPFLIVVLWLVLQRKKWKNGKLKLRELMKQRGRIELREVSIATKLKMGKMKKLFSDLMKEDTTFKGFFVNNDKEFVFQSVLVDTVIRMGKLSFEEFSVKVGVTTIEAKEMVATLLKEKAISGAFTLDGNGFVTEDRLMDEIGKV